MKYVSMSWMLTVGYVSEGESVFSEGGTALAVGRVFVPTDEYGDTDPVAVDETMKRAVGWDTMNVNVRHGHDGTDDVMFKPYDPAATNEDGEEKVVAVTYGREHDSIGGEPIRIEIGEDVYTLWSGSDEIGPDVLWEIFGSRFGWYDLEIESNEKSGKGWEAKVTFRDVTARVTFDVEDDLSSFAD